MNMATANYNLASSLFQRLVLSPLGLKWENAGALWLLLMFAGLTFGSLYYFNGDIPVVLTVLYLAGIFVLSLVRVDYSLYLLMAGVMLFEQYTIPGFEPITHEIRYFNNFKEIPYLPSIPAAMMNVVEIHLSFIFLSVLVLLAARKDLSLTPIPAWMPFILFIGVLGFSLVYGLSGGGDLLVAIWEVRALFYLCLMYIVVPQIIRTKKQIRILFWVFISGVAIKAFQGIARFVVLGFTTGGHDVLTNHEDPVFMVTLFILLAAFIVYRTGDRQAVWLVVLLLPMLLGFYVAQRRAAYASLMVSVAVFIVLLPPARRRQFMKLFTPVLIALLIYGTAFWNSNSTLGRPAQMIKSGLTKPEIETNYRDYSSNLYRDFENYNLAQTVSNNPIIGVGFGKKYEQPIPLVEIPFPLMDYIPHNQILWVLVKMGGVGFFLFWFFFNSFAATGSRVLMRVRDPYLKAVSTVIVIAVINQMVVSYFDLQLTYYRNMLYLGCLMGMLPAIKQISASDENEKTEEADEL